MTLKIKGDNTDVVHLTPGDVIDIQKSLKEAFNYESSPVFMEVNSFTPLSAEDKNVDMSQHRETFRPVKSC